MRRRANCHSFKKIGRSAILCPVRPLVELPDEVGADLAWRGQDPKEIPTRRVRARRRGEPRWQQGVTSGCARVQECSSRVEAGLFQAEAIDPSVTSPLCAAKAARTSSFSRGGTPK
jgi:hypothetical protein